MTKSCSCCKADIKNTVHTCGEVIMSSDYHVFASLTFEKRFDFNLCDNKYVSTTNLTMVDTDSDLFFYSVAKDNTPICRGGKNMNALQMSALRDLTDTMNVFTEQWDAHRPSSETVHANKIRMYLSRINNPLRKSNNDKGELKLHNHARVLTQLGGSWISNYVSDQLFIIDVLDPPNRNSYIARSRDYQAFPRENYKIVTKSTLYKLDNYFNDNQGFTVDKKRTP